MVDIEGENVRPVMWVVVDGLSPRLAEFYQAAAAQPEVVRQIFGVPGGTVPVREVCSAENIRATICGTEVAGVSSVRDRYPDRAPSARETGHVERI